MEKQKQPTNKITKCLNHTQNLLLTNQNAVFHCPPDVEQFIYESLKKRKPSLIPFTIISPCVSELAKYLKRHGSQSHATAYLYIWSVHKYCRWCGADPDQLIADCVSEEGLPNQKALLLEARRLDDYIGALQSDDLSPGHISNCVKAVKTFFRINNLRLELPYKLKKYTVSRDRAPTPEELSKLMDIAKLREKLIILLLATGGFRVGTLTKLCYRHIREDLERNVTPIHIHVEASITKGKYHDYDTFINKETSDYLRAYIEFRKNGGLQDKIPSESLQDNSPLIRDEHSKTVKPISASQIYNILHRLLAQAGLLGTKVGRRYLMKPHSFRKFFRTQMTALGVQTDYVEYMMGHTISTYHDIQMKGIEFLRGVYAASGIGIRPKTKASRIEILKEMVRAIGFNPEEILTRDALKEPHRTVVSSKMETSRIQIDALMSTLRKGLKQELVNSNKTQKRV